MAQFQTIGVAEDAGFGLVPFGTTSFGGTSGQIYTLPALEVPSTDPVEEDWIVRDEVVHRRRGAVVGARRYTTRRKYRMNWAALPIEDIQALRTWYETGQFYVVGDEVYAPESKVKVLWVGEFNPERLRGPYWRLELVLEEVLS